MRFTAEQHLAAAKYIQKCAAKLTGKERELVIRKSNSLTVDVLMLRKDKGGICIDGFDRTSLGQSSRPN